MRGDGIGMWNEIECIYDFDVYNDLGMFDVDLKNVWFILGGSVEFFFLCRMWIGCFLMKFSKFCL